MSGPGTQAAGTEAASRAGTQADFPGRRATTLPGALDELARAMPGAVALREKKLGVWNEITWAEYRDAVARTADWLETLGAGPGSTVAVFSENRSEWLYAELAIMLLGGLSLGIHPATYEEELDQVLRKGAVEIVFCGGQEEVDRLLAPAVKHRVRHIVVLDSRGTRLYTDERLLFWEDRFTEAAASRTAAASSASGASQAAAGEDAAASFRKRAAELDPDRICVAVSSSGRVDYPRQALFDHRTLLAVGDRFAEIYGLTGRDSNLCYLPLCHYIEKLFSLVLPLRAGNLPHIAESEDTVLEDLREVSPSLFVSWPKFWERMRLMTLYRMSQTSLVRDFFFESFARRGLDRVKFTPGRRTFAQRLTAVAGDQLFFRAFQNRLGLRDCRAAFSSGGELPEHVVQWFLGIGLPLTEFYGTSETMGAGFANEAGSEHAGTAGKPFPDLRFRFARDRELMLKGPYLCAGYLGETADGAQADGTQADGTQAEGWFYTGDTGFEDARDRLRITGNKYTIVANADQERFSIKRSEDALRECPYVREIVCIGEDRPFVSALIELDFDRTADEVRLENVRFKRYEDLTNEPAVAELIEREIARLNEDLIEVEKVRAFRFFPHELREENGELSFDYTPRRRLIARKYADLIDGMYRQP